MSTVIWVNHLENGRVVSDEGDKGTLYRFAPRLDELCNRLEVRRLSDFHDLTDASYNLTDEELPDGVEDTFELMARKGKWFRPESGIETVEALLVYLRKHPARFGLLSNRYQDIVKELDDCLKSIRGALRKGAKFHLCVVL